MGRNSMKVVVWLLLLVTSIGGAEVAHSYPGATHQQLMFLAARQYNECVRATPELRLSALQVRYAARAAVSQAEVNFMRRLFRWGYYERAQQATKSTLWVVETRLHEHFNALVAQGEEAETEAELFSIAGRIAAYVQDVSSPVRVVPIYSARFWRFNTNDRFDHFKLNEDPVALALTDACERVMTATPLEFTSILKATADQTLAAILEPIPGMPSTWQAFWRLAKNPTDFGEYGPAGNRFGARTTFRCGDERCVLLNKDPLYDEFARARHIEAVVGTMRVLHSLQLRRFVAVQPPVSAPEESPASDLSEDIPAAAGVEDAASSMARSQIRNLSANE